ncbi:MAG: hypothetical protein IT434_05975 [Phycisphaerales bacterium]|jgi:hypothetical protein|nr:hypothetical protein [Phycisphaerales bacterium]
MSQSKDNSRTNSVAEPAPDASGPRYVWRVNLWKLWLQVFAIAMMPNSMAAAAWLLSPSSERSLPGFLLCLTLVFMIFGLIPFVMPWRCEATRDSLVLVRGIGRTTYPRSAIRGVCTFHSSKRPIRTLLLRTRARLPSLRDCFPEHEAIFDTLTSIYGTCECTPELEPDSPLWKSVADEHAEHAMIRRRHRIAGRLEALGVVSILATIAAVIWRDAAFDWLFGRPVAPEPGPLTAARVALTALATMAGVTLVGSLGTITIRDLFLGGAIREIVATREALTIRRTLRTTVIPRDRILFVEPSRAHWFGSVRIYLRGRGKRPRLMRVSHNGRGLARWRFPAALIWLYGRAPTATNQAHLHTT